MFMQEITFFSGMAEEEQTTDCLPHFPVGNFSSGPKESPLFLPQASQCTSSIYEALAKGYICTTIYGLIIQATNQNWFYIINHIIGC